MTPPNASADSGTGERSALGDPDDVGKLPVPAVLPVGLLVSSARLILEKQLGLVWVSGEISNFTRAASGHCYFNLKDAQAQVRCVFFRHKAQFAGFSLKDGLAVEVRATATIYEARGDFQLNVEVVRLSGVGALYEKFARLKAQLEAAGWFAAERKRPLPAFPRAVGIVTSPQAAALRDVLTTLRARWPALAVVLYPCPVQGEGAAAAIAQAIRTANARAEVDALLVCRGGGSIEDLWAFNEEVVAQAVFDSRLPIVSGVGHETDFTICDFVADARAPTPTAAAALIAPDRREILRVLAALAGRGRRAIDRAMEGRMQRLDATARRLVHPAARLAQQRRDTGLLAARLVRALAGQLDARRARLEGLRHRYGLRRREPLPHVTSLTATRERWQRAGMARIEREIARVATLERSLSHLNPQAVLERGYALVTRADGALVHDAAQLAPGDDVRLGFARGSAAARVTRRDLE